MSFQYQLVSLFITFFVLDWNCCLKVFLQWHSVILSTESAFKKSVVQIMESAFFIGLF